jgi:hypothetical protein
MKCLVSYILIYWFQFPVYDRHEVPGLLHPVVPRDNQWKRASFAGKIGSCSLLQYYHFIP